MISAASLGFGIPLDFAIIYTINILDCVSKYNRLVMGLEVTVIERLEVYGSA